MGIKVAPMRGRGLKQEETKEKSEAVWIPLSQIIILNEDSKTGEIEIEIPEWIAQDKELI